MTDLGSGPRLDSNFDLAAGSDGDLDYQEGINELSKDLALAVAEVLTTGSTEKLSDPYDEVTIPDTITPDVHPETGEVTDSGGLVGSQLFDGVLKDSEVLVANLIDLDPRVEIVTRVDAERMDDDPDSVRISAQVLLTDLPGDEQFDFIIPPS